MNKGNMITRESIHCYEVQIARCGKIRLIWHADPKGINNRYEIRSGDETLSSTPFLEIALSEYNQLVI